jgi:FkbM family methyltransferase
MKIVRGWAFPSADQFMVNELGCDGTYQLDHLHAALRYVTEHGCAIDGGAHVGTWSKVMAGVFEKVVAIEPSADTFECLDFNMAQFACANVDRKNCAIGAETGFVTMGLDAVNEERKNTGARFAQAGGIIPVETIDGWRLDRVGFLKLDIEGSEQFALQGAKDTLKRCKPIVLFENKRLWTRHFGLPKGVVADFLTAQGYRLLETVSMDQIWGPK